MDILSLLFLDFNGSNQLPHEVFGYIPYIHIRDQNRNKLDPQCHNLLKWPSPWTYIEGKKLMETSRITYT